MKRILVLVFILITFCIQAQENINELQLKSVNIDDLSDLQISEYWERAKEKGYSLTQLEVITKAKGMSQLEFSKLKSRILSLGSNLQENNLDEEDDIEIVETDLLKFGLTEKEVIIENISPIYGMDFFNNPNVNFVPNLNVATPDSYQVGPGDKLLIDVWGASEASYQLEVGLSGAIRINRIGPIYVSGLSMKEASNKIIDYLKKIYRGIDSSVGDVSKTYASVSLAQARTVQINIIGEVKVPGTYNLSAMSSIMNALYASGGPTEMGSFRSIELVRNGKLLDTFDIYKYLKKGIINSDLFLRDQDVIIVPAYKNQINIIGQVKRPGIYELTSKDSFEDLIWYANGFTAEANQSHIAISRYNGKERELIDLNYLIESNISLRNGDQVNVARVVDRFTNKVSISGAIYSPGNFEYTEDLDLKTLIIKANGLRDFAFLDRGQIHRKLNDVEDMMMSFDLRKIMNGEDVIKLQAGDVIRIFDKTKLREKYTVTIDGAVNSPDTFIYEDNLSIEDVILLADGFKEGADPSVINIFRNNEKGDEEILSFNLMENIDSDVVLKPFDRISVQYFKGYSKLKNISIEGQIAYPGTYSLESQGERISDLLDKSGGLLKNAYKEGITIVRNIDNDTKKAQLEEIKKLVKKDSLVDQDVVENTFRVGVNYMKILDEGKGSKFDLILEEGDVVIVPIKKSTVQIQGSVMNSAMKPFEPGKGLKNYVNGAGGFAGDAKKSKTYVVYANGSVKGTRNFLWFKFYPKVEPGSVIIVPEKPERKGVSAAEIIGITSAVTSMGILIQTAIQN